MTSHPVRRVLMTADTVGGVWTYALELARGLAPAGVQVLLATMGAPVSPAQRAEVAALENVELRESHYRLEWMFEPWDDVDAAGAWLLQLEQEWRPDVVHLNGFAHGAVPFAAPTVVVGHSCVLSWWQAVKGESAPPEWEIYRARVAAGLRQAGEVIAPTAAMLDSLAEHYGPLPRSRVIYNSRALAPRPLLPKMPYILAAGRLGDEAKNIAALGRVAGQVPWPIYLAGAAQDASGQAPLPGAVRHLGVLPPPELMRWMHEAAIYCLPARYEPFGLSILEAALNGCALVLGDIPTLRELWHGAAIFVDPRDETALAQALHRLTQDSAQRTSLGVAAKARATEFTPQRQMHAYLELYAELRGSSLVL